MPAAVSLGISCGCHAPLEDIIRSSCGLNFNKSLLFTAYHQSIILWRKCCSPPPPSPPSALHPLIPLLTICLVCVFASNGRRYKTHLLSSHRVQNNRNVFFFLQCLFPFPPTAAAFTIEFECHAFSAGVVWLSTDRELCWIPIPFIMLLTTVSWLPCHDLWEVILVPLLYVRNFGCLSPV